MSEEYILENAIPKFTVNNIVQMINEKLKNSNKEEYCKNNNIDYDMLNDILLEPNFMSYNMYVIASKILNKTIDELTELKESKKTVNFRKLKNCNIEEITTDLDFAKLLFDEIIINAKLNNR